MPTLIRIDPATLRRNPRAGETSTDYVRGVAHRRRSVRNEPGGRVIEEEAIKVGVGEWVVVASRTCFGRGKVVEESEERVDREVETVCHSPNPPWLFNYLPSPVTCRNCGQTFPHTALGSDSFFNGEDGEDWSDAICPKCGEPDCCEVEYEKPPGL